MLEGPGLAGFVGGAKEVFEEEEDTGDFVDEIVVAGAATKATEAAFSFGLIGKIFPSKGSFTAWAGAACLELPAAAVPVRAWCAAALSRPRFRRDEHLCR